jgi:hypothetical protein
MWKKGLKFLNSEIQMEKKISLVILKNPPLLLNNWIEYQSLFPRQNIPST